MSLVQYVQQNISFSMAFRTVGPKKVFISKDRGGKGLKVIEYM
jgi:hypothetical protein